MIAIGSDHGGYALKNDIIRHFKDKGISYKDFGTFDDGASVDYPDFTRIVALAVISGECESGIIVCGTGIGVAIAANKFRGIRAALCTNCYMAKMARQHNDANILTLGGRVLGAGLALDIVDTFLGTSFSGGHHIKRLDKIAEIENGTE